MGKDQELLEASRTGDIVHVGKLLELLDKRAAGPLASFRRSPCINRQDVNGYTPLHHACLNGHIGIVRLLLARGALVDIPDIRGSTPLYLAAWANQSEIVKMLLMHPRTPANPNAQTSENETPLHCAAQHGHNTVLATLLAYGGDPSIRNNSFQTALDLAAQFGRLQAVQLLLRHHPELIVPFQSANHRANSQSPSSYPISPKTHIFTHTCLHLASRNGHTDVVETLLAAGVDVNVMTHAGSALHEAALCGKRDVVLTLLKAGIDPQAVDGNGRTVFDVLQDYPPHMSYEIVTAIKDFCNLSNSDAHFRPIVAEQCIKTTKPTTAPRKKKSKDKFNSVPRTRHEKPKTKEYHSQETEQEPPNKYDKLNHKQQQLLAFLITYKPTRSHSSKKTTPSNNATANTYPRGSYVLMKPILPQGSSSSESLTAKRVEFKPVFQQPQIKLLIKNIQVEPTKLPPQNYEPMWLAKYDKKVDTSSSSSRDQTPETRPRRVVRCVDEYVDMSGPHTPTPTTTPASSAAQTPINTPDKFRFNNGANLSDDMKYQSKVQQKPISIPKRLQSIDSNNNKEHSPTPDFPPPSVGTAEKIIFEFIQPTDTKSKRQSFKMDGDDLQNLDQYFREYAQLQEDDEEEEVDAHIEEFVGDKPFAGLFKGSTLNLAGTDDEVLCDRPAPLRSPSLVKSIQPIPPARNASLKVLKQRETSEFNASNIWAEIDDIFERIDNEVQRNIEEIKSENRRSKELEKTDVQEQEIKPYEIVTQEIKPNGNASDEKMSNDLEAAAPKSESLPIRKPSELLFSPSNIDIDNTATITEHGPKTASPPAHWLHAMDELLYGEIEYNVFYLGSTVIRNLQGTASTRMSIQKLKIDESDLDLSSDAELLKDCTSSTKYLKANNLQSRLAVGIAISYLGVKFNDLEKQSMICIHPTQNINCVCQDAEDLRYFAYITKEQEIYYCHVFMVDNVELAKEIILTLGQAFEIAYQLAISADIEANGIEISPTSQYC